MVHTEERRSHRRASTPSMRILDSIVTTSFHLSPMLLSQPPVLKCGARFYLSVDALPHPVAMASGELEALQVARCGAVVPKSADVLAAATDAFRVRAMRRTSPSCRQARSCWVFPRRNGGKPNPRPARPPAARAANCATFRSHAGRDFDPGSDGFGDRRASISDDPTQREASMTPYAWPPGPPEGRRSADASREPRAGFNRRPAAYEAAALPLGHRGLHGPSHRFFQCMMRVCPHGCLVRRATGGTVWWSRRDSNPRPSRCERDALPLRHGPMPALPYAEGRWKGVIRVAALRRWCPRPDSNRRRPP